ncbi:hypothetical protein [Streptomyces longispororuber]|uniref:hypothetical protein n=1 Tax=Streptomyces longispororuber TaxID=68230 RepID=UPI00210D53A3|nr:hypothetical protein [Streptomyces longispororuber]MCQ4211709.1 hypothetical protein [Streptomyces longispororuber]
MRYLTITGTLLDEITLRLTHGFRIDEPPDADPPGGERSPDALIVESVGPEGRVLGRGLVRTVPLCAYRSGLPAPRLVAGAVAVVEGAASLRFLFHGREVHRFVAPLGSPEVRLSWRPDGEQYGTQLIRWDAHHPECANLAYVVLFSTDSRTWTPLCLPQSEPETSVDFDELPGGPECRVRVMASDGLHTAVVDSPAFAVRRKGPQPLILCPDDGAEIPFGAPVVLMGQAASPEDPGRFSDDLRWRSSRDGDLGSGPSLDVALSLGDHTLTLEAAGSEREAFVMVTVRPDPCRSDDARESAGETD